MGQGSERGANRPLLSAQATRRRAFALAALGVAALLGHALVVGGVDWAWPQPATPARAAAVQVRLVEPVDQRLAAVAEAPVRVPQPIAKPVVARVRPVPGRTPPVIAPTAAPEPQPDSEQVAVPAFASPALLIAAAAPAAPEPVAEIIPHYRTQIPPAITLHYVMQRGALRGNGAFSWRPDGDHYELKLVASVAGLNVLTQVSSGGFDAAGIAPMRFTDQRLRRGTKAANFQRAAGKITFSGPTSEFALPEGAQDRLSWMVQLGAIVAAEPRLRGVGAKVVMYVVGANGEAGTWAFDCTAIESVATGAGTVDALKFVREPREAYDTQVQVWIDPARHYLPVRAMQKSGSGDDAFELRLQSVDGA